MFCTSCELELATGKRSATTAASTAPSTLVTAVHTFGTRGDYVALLRRMDSSVASDDEDDDNVAIDAAVTALWSDALAPAGRGEGFDELCGVLTTRVRAFVAADGTGAAATSSGTAPSERALAVLIAGASLLSLFVQMNYTGPMLKAVDLVGLVPDLAAFASRGSSLGAEGESTSAAAASEKEEEGVKTTETRAAEEGDEPSASAALARGLLNVDGEPVYPLVRWPSFLVAARAVLVALERVCAEAVAPSSASASRLLLTSPWWSARATVVHQSLIVSQLCEGSDTLRTDSTRLFEDACTALASVSSTASSADAPSANADEVLQVARATVWIERGLALQVAEQNDEAEECFATAQREVGFESELTGVTGRGTKFQKFDRAQLVLKVVSSLAPIKIAAPEATDAGAADAGAAAAAAEAEDEDDDAPSIDAVAPPAAPPAPQRAGRSINKMREVTLESLDPMTHMLDVPRVRATEESTARGAAVDSHGFTPRVVTVLHPIEQALLMALCEATKRRGAIDNLTQEQMGAYVACVLQQPELNWTTHSHALLGRSLIEFETSQRRERALMQLQILVDQQEQRLSAFHSARDEAVAATAGERLRHVWSLSVQPRWELQRILGRRYLQCGSLKSALDIFQRLQMWGEVIVCLVAMGLDERAERLIRSLLEVQPSPSLWCSLALLSNNPEMYERAWEISGHRCARAMRDLARLEHKRGDLDACVTHMRKALNLNMSRIQDWFLVGCVRQQQFTAALTVKDREVRASSPFLSPLSLSLSYYYISLFFAHTSISRHLFLSQAAPKYRVEALEAFLRAVRYKPRYWQAWGNISAIHMQSNSPRPALIAIKEAIKYTTMVKQWKLTANAIVIATAVGPDEYLYIVELAYVWLKYSENSHSATQDYSDGGASDSTVAGFATGAFWGFEHA